jgi:hypothetical protein
VTKRQTSERGPLTAQTRLVIPTARALLHARRNLSLHKRRATASGRCKTSALGNAAPRLEAIFWPRKAQIDCNSGHQSPERHHPAPRNNGRESDCNRTRQNQPLNLPVEARVRSPKVAPSEHVLVEHPYNRPYQRQKCTLKRCGTHRQALAMEGRVIVLHPDKMQIEKDKHKRDDVTIKRFADQLSWRILMTNSPRQ